MQYRSRLTASVQQGLDYTAAWNMSMLQSADTQLAMQGVLAKTTPAFPQLSGATSKAKL
jgi:delta(3,5)-delta(2,4)-dienoyl-CoA isomerase